jgi:hypothetical protein
VSEEKEMDPTLIAYIILVLVEVLAKWAATSQAPSITIEQVLAKAVENKAAHDALQNQP